MEKICVVCQKEFKPIHFNSRVCSEKCRKIRYRGTIPKQCQTCHSIFYVKKYRKNNARFCSSRCWTTSDESKKIVVKSTKERNKLNPPIGKNNNNWRGGTTPEFKKRLLNKLWKRLRIMAFEIYGEKCKCCDSKINLHVHHIIPYRKNGKDILENLEIVCSKCHPKIEVTREFKGKFKCLIEE